MSGTATSAATGRVSAVLRAAARWARPAAGALILLALVHQLGAGPFLAALRGLDARTVALAVCLTAMTTLCSSWRWGVVSAGLGLRLRPGQAVGAYYRSQFLNSTLPAGVLGDLQRGVWQGRETRALGRGLRSVAWERSLGQAVQVVLAAVLVLVLPSPLRSLAVVKGLAAGALALGAVVGVVALARSAPEASVGRTLLADLRGIRRVRHAWPTLVVTSGAVVAGHVTLFLVAVHAAGAHVALLPLVPLALVVLVVAALPANIAGWGPREGVAAWAFAATGMSAGQGATAAALYGVLVLVAVLPGGVLLCLGRRRRLRASM